MDENRRWHLEDFKRVFPNLYRELLESSESDRRSERRGPIEAEELRGYVPRAEDYLRRCSNDSEALEVIDYLTRSGEITLDESEKLKHQLSEKGLRSFGTYKEENYYLKRCASR
ncbi:MAG: DUF2095 domain-containing protein [Aigarchaeota archaeon]|nr:DUF2095 domain-containing protein [Aigarchaeota archaeon]MDW8092454.1 DUF2095 family protein [Nitrososphaerota archaeon]